MSLCLLTTPDTVTPHRRSNNTGDTEIKKIEGQTDRQEEHIQVYKHNSSLTKLNKFNTPPLCYFGILGKRQNNSGFKKSYVPNSFSESRIQNKMSRKSQAEYILYSYMKLHRKMNTHTCGFGSNSLFDIESICNVHVITFLGALTSRQLKLHGL